MPAKSPPHQQTPGADPSPRRLIGAARAMFHAMDERALPDRPPTPPGGKPKSWKR